MSKTFVTYYTKYEFDTLELSKAISDFKGISINDVTNEMIEAEALQQADGLFDEEFPEMQEIKYQLAEEIIVTL